MYPEAPETEFQLMSIRLEDDAVAVNPVGAAGTTGWGSSQAVKEKPITATRAIAKRLSFLTWSFVVAKLPIFVCL